MCRTSIMNSMGNTRGLLQQPTATSTLRNPGSTSPFCLQIAPGHGSAVWRDSNGMVYRESGQPADTVDGRNPAPLGMYKTCKSWDKLPINWCRISAINSSRKMMEHVYAYNTHISCFMRGFYLYLNWCRIREFLVKRISNTWKILLRNRPLNFDPLMSHPIH